MKFVRDVRDEPGEAIDWAKFRNRYRVTMLWLAFGGAQLAIRIPLLATAMVLITGLPVTFVIDWCRSLRQRRLSLALRDQEFELLNYRP